MYFHDVEQRFISSKNGKGRSITVAPFIVSLLKRHKAQQSAEQIRAGGAWENSGFVFTDELGRHVSPHNVYHSYKRIVASIGMPEARFHNLRHSYAVAAIHAGDDIKTVQGNLGHATSSFTLDVYGHVTEEMKKSSADHMEKFIEKVSGG